jgi:hypothetical protein
MASVASWLYPGFYLAAGAVIWSTGWEWYVRLVVAFTLMCVGRLFVGIAFGKGVS